MNRRLAAWLAFFLLAMPGAQAGAWTLPAGKMQAFAGMVASQATKRFDNSGEARVPTRFNKLLVQGWMEYGVSDAFTLVAAPEYVSADLGGAQVRSTSFEAGGRLLLTRRLGMISLQATAKTAGGFGMSTSYGAEAGRQIEARLLYGGSFKLFGHDGFVDVEAAQRWVKRPRPDENAFDASLGFWLRPKDLLLAQSFTVLSGEGVKPPFEPYRQTKLQIALVHRLSPRWAVQSGYFYTPWGRNIVQESGAVASLWFQL